MVYVFALNPAVDYDVYFDGFHTDGRLNEAKNVNYRAAGKGINVSKMLHNLGINSTILGFAGGFTGHFIKRELDRLEIQHKIVDLEETTRINIKLAMADGEREITGISPTIPDEAIKKLYRYLDNVKIGDIVIFSGSIPKSLPENIYHNIVKSLPCGVLTILDTRGDAIVKNANSNYLLKPNIHELGEIFETEIHGLKNAIYYGNKLIDQKTIGTDIYNVIISMGGEGAVFINENESYFAEAPEGKLVNSMGAGDSVVAGFVYGKLNGFNEADSFRMAVACGSATAFSLDMGEKSLAEQLFDKIVLKKC